MAHYIADRIKLNPVGIMVIRNPLLGFLALLAIAPQAQAERLGIPLPLPQGVQTCELQGWAYSNGLVEVVLRQSPDKDSKALGIVPVDDPSKTASHGNMLYPAEITIVQYDGGWLKVSALRDLENAEAERAVPPTPGWIAANSIRFNIQSGNGYAAPDTASAVLIDMKGEWATEVGEIEQVHACQANWVLVDYRQTLTRDAQGALVPVAEEKQTRKQAWFRNTCGDLFTTCDRQLDP
ncbi:hypothetical protein JHL21_03675 [Devosia sp. WQ 349]|uniref:hypothetical protein n=1 Tax=Devosia sp. WQ 349K1 TaxID=2800329 RepID=UPI001905F162|nr:hypothetical protein [Devosia sp. WQ 349K1]MBK1793592.1 hypothetical protein [Devosia sp. WQ 349K1]